MKYKMTTLMSLYSNNPSYLLSRLMEYGGELKTIIVYGKDAEVNLNGLKNVRVINIFRKGKEYHGFVNAYWAA